MLGKLLFAAVVGAAVANGPPPIARVYAIDIDGQMLLQEAVDLNLNDTDSVEGVKLMSRLQEEGRMKWSYTIMGGKIIVKEIAGTTHQWPKTAWTLTHIHPLFHGRPHPEQPGMASHGGEQEREMQAEHHRFTSAMQLADEEMKSRGPTARKRFVPPPMPGHKVNPNVNLADVFVKAGDILQWRMFVVGEQPLSLGELPPLPPADDKKEL